MKRLSSCLIAASLLAVACPVAAQQQPLPAGAASSMGQQQLLQRNARQPVAVSNAWTRAEFETMLDAASGNNLPAQPLERIDLANRVSTLIELGRCTEAREEASEAGDRQMAIRARQLCRADRDQG